MKSTMIEVSIPVDVYIHYGFWGNVTDITIEPGPFQSHIPLMVGRWMEREIRQSYTEGDKMPYSVKRTISFDVEVFTQVRNNQEVGYRAECHTVCPNFVAAWVEQEAMKQYNKEQMEVKV